MAATTAIDLPAAELANMTRWARRHTRCRADADDLIQDVQVKLLTSYDASKGTPAAFAWRCLRNLAVDTLRRNLHHSLLRFRGDRDLDPSGYDEPAYDPRDAESVADLAADAMEAVVAEIARRENATNARTRATADVVREMFADGVDDSEIAARHNLTANAVYILRHNVVETVRREMAVAAA